MEMCIANKINKNKIENVVNKHIQKKKIQVL